MFLSMRAVNSLQAPRLLIGLCLGTRKLNLPRLNSRVIGAFDGDCLLISGYIVAPTLLTAQLASRDLGTRFMDPEMMNVSTTLIQAVCHLLLNPFHQRYYMIHTRPYFTQFTVYDY